MSAFEQRQQQLLQQLNDLICDSKPTVTPTKTVTTGWRQLDAMLPASGWRQGQLVEWLGDVKGSGVSLLGLWSAWQMAQSGGAFVVVDSSGRFFPPAAAALGIRLSRMMVVSPQNKADFQWTLDQILRCPAVGAVWVNVPAVNSRTFRRWQLAVEESDSFGVLVRERKYLREPSWAHLRLSAVPLAGQGDWRFRVQLERAARGSAGGSCELDFNEILETSGRGFFQTPSIADRDWSQNTSPQLNKK
ncbi:MAG: hypothetical protein VX738_01795 [Planctomycetota bacterium]|nr:hypothetical protein [Planctomycetota bacterium]